MGIRTVEAHFATRGLLPREMGYQWQVRRLTGSADPALTLILVIQQRYEARNAPLATHFATDERRIALI